ncbi:MAG: hypothetical protein KDL31_03570 [Kiritimatiellae bacterium]|nr:hypothetical protein [Kiritimatiellia bacterium]MCB1101339.1 hypothetical protein [Kiritimatiellia bacterium]
MKNKAPKEDTPRRVTFEITTRRPLAVGQQVFISGSIDMLGNWEPDGFPLTRVDDNLWKGLMIIDPDVAFEFKITRGTWDSEEVAKDKMILPENIRIEAGRKPETFRRTVYGWLDDLRD